MELFDENEIRTVLKRYGNPKILSWSVENYSDKMIGNLGEHLRLKVTVEANDMETVLHFFVKCMPRNDEWKASYIKRLGFFHKEYVMLSQLFKEMENKAVSYSKWRPSLLYIREDLFVTEDVAEMGYRMPNHQKTMKYDELKATVETLAKFHAQSLIYEEKKSAELGKPYRIWNEYENYLQEPLATQQWRNTGRNAVIDFLKVFSVHRLKPNFKEKIETLIPIIFDRALTLMTPSAEFRNVVTHRDLWTNNILIKKQEDGKFHSLIIDFQTVLYCPPMLDLSSLLFFNTTKAFRYAQTDDIINFYYDVLSEELTFEGIKVETIYTKDELIKCYVESTMFGITQAALIVPIVAMSTQRREEFFLNPENRVKANLVSRSKELVQVAKEDDFYRMRVSELFDDIVERYIYSKTTKC